MIAARHTFSPLEPASACTLYLVQSLSCYVKGEAFSPPSSWTAHHVGTLTALIVSAFDLSESLYFRDISGASPPFELDSATED